jgi:hypothetical protein
MAYRRTTDDGAWIFGLFYLLIIAVGVVGWIWNIVKIVGAVSDPITTMFIIRCVGVFLAPLGAILGFL